MRPIGIDLGTTNTAAAIGGAVVHLSSEQGAALMPSVVALPPSGATIVGTNARRRRAIDSKNTIFSAKRIIGRLWHSERTQDFKRRYPFDLVEIRQGLPAFRTRAGVFTAVEIGGVLLGALRRQLPEDAAARAVLAIPCEFDLPQRRATGDAARQAGFTDVAVVEEPVATALAYHRLGAADTRRVAVYDMGGGTFNLAVIEHAGDAYRVRAHGGDLYLGGDDVDHGIATWAAGEILSRHRWDLRADKITFDRLVAECERAKVRLCRAERTRIDLAQVDPAAPPAANGLPIDRSLLEELTTDLVRRTFTICDHVLAAAELRARDIDEVLLAGGTALLPMVRRGVELYFGRPPRCELDPLEVVAMGASVAAELGTAAPA